MKLGTAVAVLAVTGLSLWYFFGSDPPVSTAANGDAVVTWAPPTEREDGTPLTALQGYRIYYGRDPGDLQETIEVGPEATEHRIENLEHGSWYFAVSAISADGLESEKSAAVEKVIDRASSER